MITINLIKINSTLLVITQKIIPSIKQWFGLILNDVPSYFGIFHGDFHVNKVKINFSRRK